MNQSNPFIDSFDRTMYHEECITGEEELELLQYILDNSTNEVVDEFAISNITYAQALNLVQSDDQFTADAQEWVDNQPNLHD